MGRPGTLSELDRPDRPQVTSERDGRGSGRKLDDDEVVPGRVWLDHACPPPGGKVRQRRPAWRQPRVAARDAAVAAGFVDQIQCWW